MTELTDLHRRLTGLEKNDREQDRRLSALETTAAVHENRWQNQHTRHASMPQWIAIAITILSGLSTGLWVLFASGVRP